MEYRELEEEIKQIYVKGISMSDAEALAAKFLYAQIRISEDLKLADLDARMRKSGLKAARGDAYLKACGTTENGKKPTEAFLDALLSTNPLVSNEQDAYDKAEAHKAELERLYDIFSEGHIFTRNVAKGSFSG